MSFPDGTEQRIMDILSLPVSTPMVSEISSRLREIEDVSPESVDIILGYFTEYDTAIDSYNTVRVTETPGIKKAGPVEFFEGGSIVGVESYLSEIKERIRLALDINFEAIETYRQGYAPGNNQFLIRKRTFPIQPKYDRFLGR